MKDRIECPFGEGEAVLKKEPRSLSYRKYEFTVIAHYYKCEDCGEEFTTNEADHITLIQVHNQYRERNGIPFVEEIRDIREKYGLSASKMSEVLRLGENGYGNYEKGEIPTPAIGALIKTAERPENFLSLLKSHNLIKNDKAIIKAISHVEHMIREERDNPDHFNISVNFGIPNNFTGYSMLNRSKIKHLLIHYIHECKDEYNDKLKLIKLLFFTDFSHYRNFGHSVSGLSYQKKNFGPMPYCFDTILNYFEQQDIIYQDWEILVDGKAREIIRTHRNIKTNEVFNEEEKSTIDLVTGYYKNSPTEDLVKKSTELNLKSSNDTENDLIGFQENAFA
ncbi:type II toxin-antitoxin system antitoxin SocA domain-containing protein [Pedobacter hartonius]|uniref:Putative zinc finger/helix-turn-helix protein, YgiT family n=1 Tax=Pedobacter hartonius TaxID=425514 RepID=A0A1H4G381_9SPHI|nr:type II toxin-antitoxin system antitoxin SocA domain-containing protein [Pedobacter hartonius]SEB04063.1 putative zinc finger/helix-turn-helix protein, YgiT family [Pedobacter hartonius]